jgi:hypothetical protein
MAKFTDYFKIVSPKPNAVLQQDSQMLGDQGSYGNYTWYQRLIQGSASRLARYREYDFMDNDVEITRALDTVAEEMTGNNTTSDDPLELDILVEKDVEVNNIAVMTLKTALEYWCEIHDWRNRLFPAARIMIKYGDAFFLKNSTTKKWEFINPRNVIAALVDEEDVTKVLAWQIKRDINKPKEMPYQPITGQTETRTEIIPANRIVRFTMNDDMSDMAPFGESILRSVYRTQKQKEMLEDAIIIYRIQRAPERRVFYIDVGKMPPQRVKAYLEQIKNEIRQKKIPSYGGGKDEIDSVYNPQSMSEDFFFAQRPDGRGSKVETLPGGQGLGELADLEYFQNKVFRGLRVPLSYMKEGTEGALLTDGKVGTAYIQELRFALYVSRLQGNIERVLDDEFKEYLRYAGFKVDDSLFRISLPEPTNFGKYKQQEVDAALLGTYSSADGVQYLAKRFILKRYLQLSDEEIVQNEQMLREEMGLDPEGDAKDYPVLYRGGGEEGGLMGGGGMMGGGMGGLDMTAGTLGGEEGMMGGEGGMEGGMMGGAEGGIPTTETPPPAGGMT